MSERLHCSRILDSLDWSMSGLDPSAILCLRTLYDPLPRRWSGGRPTPQWREAFAQSLAAQVRHAVRPARETVGANTTAVLFADRSEFLACLAVDWLQGAASQSWWWKTLFPDGDIESAVGVAWSNHATAVPAALLRLADCNLAIRFLNAVQENTLRTISVRVGHTFGLRLPEPKSPGLESNQESVDPADSRKNRVRWVLDSLDSRELNSAQAAGRQLYAVCHLLQSAPALVRSSEFPVVLESWSLGPYSPTGHRLSGEMAPATRPDEMPRVPDSKPSPLQELISIAGLVGQPLDAGFQTEPEPLPMVSRDAQPYGGQPPDLARTVNNRSKPDQPVEQSKTALIETGGPLSPKPIPATEVEANDPRFLPLSEPVVELFHTRWGGVFYLVNAALALELYADFTQPLRPGLQLPLWDFLALVGCHWIGSESDSDPLMPTLARLSGREPGEEPAAWFVPPDSWRVPLDWLKPFPEKSGWHWGVDGDRLQVLHPSGFIAWDEPLGLPETTHPPEQQLKRRLFDMCAALNLDLASIHPTQRTVSHRTPVTPLERWLKWLVPYLEARLARAIGGPKGGSIRDLLFRHSADVEVGADRVRVHFSLVNHPIELRIAGLDRDPGWVPAAGRTIVFLYE